MKKLSAILGSLLTACGSTATPDKDFKDLSQRAKPKAIVTAPWTEVVVGVPDLDDVPRLFKTIGGFETVSQDADSLVVRAKGADTGLVRFIKTPSDAAITRPYGSRSWDTGCYFSIMMRAKNLPSIIEDAKPLGWEPLTEMAFLEFGPSQLNIVVLTHKTTGVQVQLYERLTTPLPEDFTPFERLSRPFNIMQMVGSRDRAYDFFQQKLGFDTFYYGPPTTSPTPQTSPIGIPTALTPTAAYMAGIVTPKAGLEWGRMEMIEVQMDGGQDLAGQCSIGNIGISEVSFDVDDLQETQAELKARGIDVQTFDDGVRIKTPDGSNIRFVQK